MNLALWSLLGFAAWTAVLVLAVGLYRSILVLSGRAAANAFPGGVQHGPPWYWRLCRAHANCIENLPLFTALVLLGSVVHVGEPLFFTLAAVVLPARIGQSTAHIASGSSLAVLVRFSFFSVQLLCLAGMGVLIAQKLWQ